jgi:hypothetical protein
MSDTSYYDGGIRMTLKRKKICPFCGYERILFEDEIDDHVCSEMDSQLYGIEC